MSTIQKGDKIRIKGNLSEALKSLDFDDDTASTMGCRYAETEQVALAIWRENGDDNAQQYVTIDLCVEIPVECCEKLD